MKKKFLALVLALVMTLTLLPVTAMAESHVHVWSADWTTKKGIHWHECTASGCDLKSDIYGNDYNVYKDGYALCEYDANGICVCGAVKPAHVHEWAAIPGARTTREHWCVCTAPDCPLESDTTTPGRIHNALHYKYKPHTFDREGYCAECNWKYTRHVHTWDETEYVHNENGHWHECTDSNCWIDNVEYNKDYAPHTLDRATGTCVCGYQAPEYTVQFDANGGNGSMAPQTFYYGVEQALTANTFTKTGYAFMGWATADDKTTVEYADGATVSNPATSGNVTLYAVWKANEYTVTFNANGGNDTMAGQTFVYDAAAQPLSANTFTKTGYTFLGWAETENGAVKYADKASVSNLATSGNVDLYAVWTPNQASTLPAQGAKYFVKHYVEKWDGSYELVETEVLSGKIDTTVTADSTKYDDNAHHVNTAASILNGVVSFDLSAADPMSSLLTLKVYYDITPYYSPVDPTPVIPSVDVDIHDDTLSDAAKAVGSAVKSGKADITPVAGYTKESIAQMQKDNALKLVVEKKNSYDPAEKSLIDKAAQEKGKAALVQFLEIDVTLRTMNDVIVAEVDDTIVDLTITVDLNAEMQKAAKEGKTIYVARAHDGKVTFIEGTLNAEKTQFTFDSSKFSTYALVAFDSQTVVAPKTADAGIFMAVSMSILSVTGSAVLLKKKED